MICSKYFSETSLPTIGRSAKLLSAVNGGKANTNKKEPRIIKGHGADKAVAYGANMTLCAAKQRHWQSELILLFNKIKKNVRHDLLLLLTHHGQRIIKDLFTLHHAVIHGIDNAHGFTCSITFGFKFGLLVFNLRT